MLAQKTKCHFFQKGFSLLEASIVLGVMSILALSSLKLFEYANNSRKIMASKREMMNLQRRTRLLLENRSACDASLNTLKFRGSAIPRQLTPASDLDTDGTPNPLHTIKLFYPNMDGSRKEPIFSHDPNDKDSSNMPLNRFGPVEIKATELIMPEHTSGADFLRTEPNTQLVPAVLVIHTTTKFEGEKEILNPVMKFRLFLAISTDAFGVSTIQSCGVDSLTDQSIFAPPPFVGNNDQIPLKDFSGRDQFYFCGFTRQLHQPSQFEITANAHTSETRCQLTPTGTGPLYNWTVTTVEKDGKTLCEVACL